MKLARKLKRKIVRLLFREQWTIVLCDQEGTPLKEFIPPADRIWADPFPVFYEGRYILFLEEQVIGKKGILGCIEVFEDLSHSSFTPILEQPHHLSWPNVFQVENDGHTDWYMVPESNRAGTIECYRAKKFPYEWIHDSTLLSGIRAADTEIYYDGNMWFLLTSIQDEKNGMNDSLFIMYSATFPSAEWKPLPGNPVITGRKNSRMAGKLYRDTEGFLVRPAQYSKNDYGQRVMLNRVEELSPVQYREHTVKTILPEKERNAVCTHTWNPCGSYIFRDIKKRYFDPLWRLKLGKRK